MKRKYFVILLLVGVLGGISGCGKSVDLSEPVSTPTPIATATEVPDIPEPTQKPVSIGSVYNLKNEEGKDVMAVRLNQVQKLQLVDWTNNEALRNGVNCCYSFNTTIEYLDKSVDADTIHVTPELLEDSGSVVSSVADVGWSGFNSFIDYYNGVANTNECEVAVQPIVGVDRIKKVSLHVESNQGEWDIPCNLKVVKKAVKGPKIKSAGEVTTVKSANGSKYSFTCDSVQIIKEDVVYGDDYLYADTFHIKYRLSLNSAPKNSVVVKGFQGSGKQTTISGKLTMALQPQGVKDLLYDSIDKAETYSEKEGHYVPYVNENTAVPVGKTLHGITNREVTNDVNRSIAFVRLRLEFDSEFSTMTLAEKLKSNLRYNVYELPVK